MGLLSDEEFANLSVSEMKNYLTELVNNMSNEQAKKVYEELMSNKEIQEHLKQQ